MAVNKTSTTGLVNLARVYYSDMLIETLRSELVYDNLLSKEVDGIVPEQFGPVIQWTDIKDIEQAQTISEGGDSTGVELSTGEVTATLIQKALKITITDRLKSFTLINKLENVINKASRSAALTIDAMIRRKATHGGFRETVVGVNQDDYTVMSNVSHSAITGGTTTATTYTNGGVTYTHLPWYSFSGSDSRPINILPTSINGGTVDTVPANFTTDAMKVSVNKLLAASLQLKKNNAPTFPDGYYRAVLSPDAAFDIMDDPNLSLFITYGSNNGNGGNGKIEYMNGEIGAIGKIRIFETTEAEKAMYVYSANNSYFSADDPASAWTPDVVTITGMGCLAMADHSSKDVGSNSMQAINGIDLNVIGFTKDKSDPHGTTMVISYKLMTVCGILNTDCGLNLLQFHSRNGHA